MKFKYSNIGDNTRENREWLEMLGYKPLRFFQGKKYLYATTSQRANAKEVWNEPYYGTVDDVDFYVSCGFVPILGNSPLFKAVSAMREDSDYMQWFITTKGKWALSKYHKKKQWSKYSTGWKQTCRKATLTELQEHFKEKEK